MISARRIHWSESENYGFVTGRVRALEVFLLDRAVYQRLIQADGVNDFINVLAATRYGEFLRLVGAENPGKAFALAGEENFNFSLRYAADFWLRELFQLHREVFNLKVRLKEKLKANEEVQKPGFGLRRDKSQKAEWKLEEQLNNAGLQVLLLAKEKNDPAVIDLGLDLFAQKRALSLTRGHDYAQGYYRLYADLTNLRTVFRLKLLGEDENVFRAAFLPGGDLGFELLFPVFRTGDYARLGKTRFFPMVQLGVWAIEKQGSFVAMERWARQQLVDYINSARYVALGYEPLLRFYHLRENELSNLRQLYAGKVAGLPAKECEELVVYG